MWSVGQYERYRDERARPFFELCARIQLGDEGQVRRVADLGAGTAETTRALCDRWPGARVTAVDNSAEMLAAARTRALPGRLEVEAGDAASWRPADGAALDVLLSNATLQWVPDHARLLPHLVTLVRPGGVIAVQMPDNFDEPSHRLLAETAAEGPWAAKLASGWRPAAVQPVAWYVETLWSLGCSVDAWTTTYIHVLPGEDAVFEWVKGTALRPVLALLSAGERLAFEIAYKDRLRRAYPVAAGGTMLPFRRVFWVAQRGS